MDVTAICERSGDWWAVSVLEVAGVFTQARRLDQVPAMVADAVSLMTSTPAGEVHVAIDARISGSLADKELEVADMLEQHSRVLQDQAAAARRAAMSDYKDAGLSVRDIGELAGVSYQRVSQILNERPDQSSFTTVKDLVKQGRKPVDIVADIERTLEQGKRDERVERASAV